MNYGALGSTILGGLMSAYANNQAMNTFSGTMDKVKGELSDWRDSIDDYKKTSKDYMSIDSKINTD